MVGNRSVMLQGFGNNNSSKAATAGMVVKCSGIGIGGSTVFVIAYIFEIDLVYNAPYSHLILDPGHWLVRRGGAQSRCHLSQSPHPSGLLYP
ncbi:hypothetical protein NC651_040617 [Populus alba x Populus x berolinensis]|nr:hypothetical protein NC651_040610 [Populus alba x Populus x berolinensis]KAJ6856066.1 hypothetical protein NC651_040617 [Populus alba x Populus x berolinensis]